MEKFLTEAPKPTEAQLKEAERLEAEQNRHLERREESWQRSDTDGFLTQYFQAVWAEEAKSNARLLKEHGGYARFPVLVCVETGEVVATKVYAFEDTFRPDHWNAPMVYRWKLPDELAEKAGRKWLPTGAKSKVQKNLGYREESRWFPAKYKIVGKGKGLSGSVWTQLFKLSELEEKE